MYIGLSILYPITCKSSDAEKIVSSVWRGCYSPFLYDRASGKGTSFSVVLFSPVLHRTCVGKTVEHKL